MAPVTNISCYKFATLTDLKPLRQDLLQLAEAHQLRGTILLSTEGINMFVAGLRHSVDALVSRVRAIPGLENLAPKYSESAEQPFRRMLVRIKKEIIAFGVEGINPALRTSPKLPAAELKQWLDEGRPITLLDTRNDYEVKLGTFRNATTLSIDHFREFPEAVRALPAALKTQPIVMFCTGGIRCEKAGPFMEGEGFQQIYQLDGGILKYFELVGGDHYDGECFVFDQRVGVDARLHETESVQCFICQSPLSGPEQEDPRYLANVSCPYCFKTTEQQRSESIAAHHAAIRALTSPLPGSLPYDNLRPLCVPQNCDHATLIDCLCTIIPQLAREYWLQECGKGYLLDHRQQPVPATQVLRAGDRLFHRIPDNTEPPVNADIRILYEDEAIIVIDKPAPLPMHPSGRFHRNTLQWIIHQVYQPQKPRAAHRLDADTTGVVVLARTAHFAGRLQPQFSRGEIGKIYLLRVHGHPSSDTLSCDAPVGLDTEGRKLRTTEGDDPRAALTHFRVLQRHPDQTSLLEARPMTGRTNQIRLHAWHLQHPILGDPAYLPGGQLASMTATSPSEAALCLHAARIEFTHPQTHERVSFESEPPSWAKLSLSPP